MALAFQLFSWGFMHVFLWVQDMTSCIAGRHGHKTLCQPLYWGFLAVD